MTFFQAMRPPSPAPSNDIRAPASNQSRELHGLAMDPGSPSYRARIPPPPCFQCGEDHVPGHSYDHAWMAEPAQVHDEPVAAAPTYRRTQTVDVLAAADVSRRVALYVGRGDMYVIAVEEAPEWDVVEGGNFRVEPAYVLSLVKLARALGVKIVDKTGGDLLMLEQEYASQYAQDHGRGTPPAGDRSPRLPGPASLGPPQDPPPGANGPDPGVSGGSSGRVDPAG